MEEELARLRQQLQEVQRLREKEQRLHEEEQRLREEERREEQQLREEERREERRLREEEQRRREEAEKRTQRTTLPEYIAACHTSVFSRLAVETDPRLTTKGSITNPRDKWCPTTIQPWPDFLDDQRAILGTLYSTYPLEQRVFGSASFLDGLGDVVSRRKIADEKSLEFFLHLSVEDPVLNIIQQLKEIPEISDVFDIGHGVIFENHPHAISEVSEEVVARETPSTPPRTPNQRQDLRKLQADQICIYRSSDAHSLSRTMLYISEYKPPHKLTLAHLRLGLRRMNIYKEVVNRKTIPSTDDEAARFQYFAERLTASAITQTYNYMIEGGLQHSLLTTGEAIVFLKIDWDDPATLYYHLAEPGPEAAAHPDQLHLCTAVGQYLTFTLMALEQRREYGQEARQRATQTLHTWAEDFETTVRSIPRDERTASSDATYIPEPTTYHNLDRSPIFNRLRKRPPRQDQCGDSALKVHDDPGSSDDESSSNHKPPDTPTPNAESTGARRSQRILARRPRGGGSSKEGDRADSTETRVDSAGDGGVNPDRPYCSQRCLLGLVNGHRLDKSCPNVSLHRRNGRPGHPISHTRWLALLHDQLKHSLDDGIVPLGNNGARGVLFKVTMLAYGYTFVSKGTVKAFIPDLKHEAAVYKRLMPVQGRHVPVLLGSVDLRSMQKIYYYDHRVYVVYLVFLSWAGCSIEEAEETGLTKERLSKTAMKSLQAVHSQHVVHKDVRAANMLFSKETNSVMLIDFERAKLLDLPRLPLAPVVPNKRAWAEDHPNEKPKRNSKGSRMLNECGELRAIFR